jgi:hypothetical protein
MLKQEVKISFDTGTLTEIIEAKKLISHYAKHHPHAGALERLHWNRAHAEKKLAALQRVIRFMDRYDLISCPVRQRSLHTLSVEGVLSKQDRIPDARICHRDAGWDHVSYWRRVGDRAPRVILTEPYSISDRTIQSYDELADRFVLEYHISNDHALWNPPDTTAVLWHRAGESLIESRYAMKAA